MVSSALWARGFRPFFLCAAVYAALLVPAWAAMWLGFLPRPTWLVPAWWHGHEMVFGVVAAAIAGFLLTSAPVWSGRPALAGAPLAGLVVLWAAGRIALVATAFAGVPPAWAAAVDLAFLPVLAVVLARTLSGRDQRRNQGIVLLVFALAVANAAVHADALGLVQGWAPRALRLAVDGVIVLVVVIGGRITPLFTLNAFRRAGLPHEIRPRPWRDRVAVASAIGALLANLAAPGSEAARFVSLAASAAVALRMLGWQTLRTGRNPLVWSLHAGMAWVVLGFALVALVPAPNAGLHALAAGAMGSMILAVMTRVALGHTGRPLALPKGAVLCYALVHAGAAARVASTLAPDLNAPLLAAGAALWSGAFALLAVLYAPLLLSPRVDGRPG